MTGRRTLLALAGIMLIAFVVSPAQAELPVVAGDPTEVTQTPNGEVRHNGSGFLFSTMLGDMPARKITVYGPSDASVDYTLYGGGRGDAWITLYVYPASHSLDDEVAKVEADLVKTWSAKRIDPPTTAAKSALAGSTRWFTGVYNGLKATNGYAVVQRGKWFLMTRWTIPDSAAQDGIERTVRALNSVPWNWSPRAPS